MRLSIIALAAASAFALAAPASAQMVNGLSGPNWNHDAPIGTKAGGALSTMQAPGEAAALYGAMQNEKVAKGIQPLNASASMSVARSSAPTSSLGQRRALRSSRTNEHALAKQRLDMHSD